MARQQGWAARPAIIVLTVIFVLNGVWLPPSPVTAAPQRPAPAGADSGLASPASLGQVTTDLVSRHTNGTAGDDRSYVVRGALSGDGRLVAFASEATTLVTSDTNAEEDIFVHDRSDGSVTRVSTDAAGTQANDRSQNPVISTDGSSVALRSEASNLVAGDTNGTWDIFVKELASGAVERVTVSSAGTQANSGSDEPGLSADGQVVTFSSHATTLVASDSNGVPDIFVRDRASGTTTRVSVDSSGTQANGASGDPSLSADGRYVAFWSDASNLVAGDTNGVRDVFVHDRQSGTTSRVSLSSAGAEGNATSGQPRISGDGSAVVFASTATTLVAGDTNGHGDIFVRDLGTSTTTRVSLSSAGTQGNNGTDHPVITPDGRFVAFYSTATNLISGDANSRGDIFLHGRDDASTIRVNLTGPGAQANDTSDRPSLSSDASVVVFQSDGSNLVEGDTNAERDVFVRDITVTTDLVSRHTDGTAGDDRSYVIRGALSGDGQLVVFASEATTLVASDTNGEEDIFVHDRSDGSVARVSTDAAGAQANDRSQNPVISTDGSTVAIRSEASNFVSGDTNNTWDIFVKDLVSGAIERVTVSSGGTQANAGSDEPGLSADGQVVTFTSSASTLVASDTNAAADVFVRDRHTGSTTRVSVDSSGTQANGASGDPSLSADGRYVAFWSDATNLVAGDTNGVRDVFVHDRQGGTTTRVSLSSAGAEGNATSGQPRISGDGSTVVFASTSTTLVAGDTNGFGDIYVRDLGSGTTTRVSVSSSGGQGNQGTDNPVITPDARYVAFYSTASNLISGDTNSRGDIFLHDRDEGTTIRVNLTGPGAQANDTSDRPSLSSDASVVVFQSDGSNLVEGDANAERDVFVRAVPYSSSLGQQSQHSFERWDLGAGDELAVNVASGNLVVSHPLVGLPYRGGNLLPLTLTYNAQAFDDVGLGSGWQLDVQRRLVLHPSGAVTFVDRDGARHVFSDPQVAGSITTYARPATLYADLERDSTPNPDAFTLTWRDGWVDTFEEAGAVARLARTEDRHGNGLDLAYDGGTGLLDTITDPASRVVDLAWNGSAQLESVTDWAWIDGSGVVQASATGNRREYRFFYDAAGQLIGWSDPLNTAGSCPTGGSHLTCLGYTADLLSEVSKTQTVTTFSSGTLGTTTRVITTEVAYDAIGLVASVTDAEEAAQGTPESTTFTWDAPHVMLVERPTTTTAYRLVSAADPFGRVSSVLRYLDPSTPIQQRTVWDTAFPSEPASVTDNYGSALATPPRTVTYEYVPSSLGLLAKVVEPLTATDERWTEYAYNANHDVIEVIVSAEGSGTERSVTRSCYSAAASCPSANGLTLIGAIAGYVDGTGGSGAGLDDADTDVRIDYGYDGNGQVTSVTRHNRDGAGSVLDDREDRFSYDAAGNLTGEIVNYANGTVTAGDDLTPNATTGARTDLTTTHTYDTAGNRNSSGDPRRAIEVVTGSPAADDFVTRWTHDALNRQLSEETPTTPGLASTQATMTSTYDELGLVRASTDFGDLVSATEFDRAGRAMRTFEDEASAPAEVTSEATYDPNGRILTREDRRQVTGGLGYTEFAYDGLGRQTDVTEATGTADQATTTTGYDALHRRTTYDVGGQLTTYAYDLGGRLIETDDGFTCATGEFDYRDLVTEEVSGLDGGCSSGAEQRTTEHTHDSFGRAIYAEITAGLGTGDVPLDDAYDAVGNLLSAAIDGGAPNESTLNLLDQVTIEDRSDGSTAKSTYDAAGNPVDQCSWANGATVSDCLTAGNHPWTDPATQVTSSAFDARNQRVALEDPVAESITTYDPDHNYAAEAVYRALGSGREHQTLYEYDDRHRLEQITYQTCAANSAHSCTDSPVDVGSVAYEHDDNDNRTRVTEDNASTASDFFYCYDARNQLSYRQTGSACSSGSNDEAWTYDEAGNRLTATTGATTSNFAYETDGRLCDVETAPTGATCSGGNVVHDSAGQISELDGWYLAYDAEGRLVSACRHATCAAGHDKVTMAYDADGRRTEMVATTAASVTTATSFRYAAGVLAEEAVNGTPVRRYITDASGSVSKLVVLSGADAGTYLVNWNGHGDALNILRVNGDGSTTLANSFTYDSWGTPTTTTHNSIGDLGFRYLYVGQFGVAWDDSLGLSLQHAGARHYSPALGRFLQPDPAGVEANAYAYGSRNPITNLDPGGLASASYEYFVIKNPKGLSGMIRIALFIMAPEVCITHGLCLSGDNRGFVMGSYCYRSRVCIEIDFTGKRVRVWAYPSCGRALASNGKFFHRCNNAHDINGLFSPNIAKVSESSSGKLSVHWRMLQSRYPDPSGLLTIDGSFTLEPGKGGWSLAAWSLALDGYPSAEAWAIYGGRYHKLTNVREGVWQNLAPFVGNGTYAGRFP